MFGLIGGTVADRFDKRRLVCFTQSTSAALALLLGILIVTGTIQFWLILISGRDCLKFRSASPRGPYAARPFLTQLLLILYRGRGLPCRPACSASGQGQAAYALA